MAAHPALGPSGPRREESTPSSSASGSNAFSSSGHDIYQPENGITGSAITRGQDEESYGSALSGSTAASSSPLTQITPSSQPASRYVHSQSQPTNPEHQIRHAKFQQHTHSYPHRETPFQSTQYRDLQHQEPFQEPTLTTQYTQQNFHQHDFQESTEPFLKGNSHTQSQLRESLVSQAASSSNPITYGHTSEVRQTRLHGYEHADSTLVPSSPHGGAVNIETKVATTSTVPGSTSAAAEYESSSFTATSAPPIPDISESGHRFNSPHYATPAAQSTSDAWAPNDSDVSTNINNSHNTSYQHDSQMPPPHDSMRSTPYYSGYPASVGGHSFNSGPHFSMSQGLKLVHQPMPLRPRAFSSALDHQHVSSSSSSSSGSGSASPMTKPSPLKSPPPTSALARASPPISSPGSQRKGTSSPVRHPHSHTSPGSHSTTGVRLDIGISKPHVPFAHQSRQPPQSQPHVSAYGQGQGPKGTYPHSHSHSKSVSAITIAPPTKPSTPSVVVTQAPTPISASNEDERKDYRERKGKSVEPPTPDSSLGGANGELPGIPSSAPRPLPNVPVDPSSSSPSPSSSSSPSHPLAQTKATTNENGAQLPVFGANVHDVGRAYGSGGTESAPTPAPYGSVKSSSSTVTDPALLEGDTDGAVRVRVSDGSTSGLQSSAGAAVGVINAAGVVSSSSSSLSTGDSLSMGSASFATASSMGAEAFVTEQGYIISASRSATTITTTTLTAGGKKYVQTASVAGPSRLAGNSSNEQMVSVPDLPGNANENPYLSPTSPPSAGGRSKAHTHYIPTQHDELEPGITIVRPLPRIPHQRNIGSKEDLVASSSPQTTVSPAGPDESPSIPHRPTTQSPSVNSRRSRTSPGPPPGAPMHIHTIRNMHGISQNALAMWASRPVDLNPPHTQTSANTNVGVPLPTPPNSGGISSSPMTPHPPHPAFDDALVQSQQQSYSVPQPHLARKTPPPSATSTIVHASHAILPVSPVKSPQPPSALMTPQSTTLSPHSLNHPLARMPFADPNAPPPPSRPPSRQALQHQRRQEQKKRERERKTSQGLQHPFPVPPVPGRSGNQKPGKQPHSRNSSQTVSSPMIGIPVMLNSAILASTTYKPKNSTSGSKHSLSRRERSADSYLGGGGRRNTNREADTYQVLKQGAEEVLQKARHRSSSVSGDPISKSRDGHGLGDASWNQTGPNLAERGTLLKDKPSDGYIRSKYNMNNSVSAPTSPIPSTTVPFVISKMNVNMGPIGPGKVAGKRPRGDTVPAILPSLPLPSHTPTHTHKPNPGPRPRRPTLNTTFVTGVISPAGSKPASPIIPNQRPAMAPMGARSPAAPHVRNAFVSSSSIPAESTGVTSGSGATTSTSTTVGAATTTMTTSATHSPSSNPNSNSSGSTPTGARTLRSLPSPATTTPTSTTMLGISVVSGAMTTSLNVRPLPPPRARTIEALPVGGPVGGGGATNLGSPAASAQNSPRLGLSINLNMHTSPTVSMKDPPVNPRWVTWREKETTSVDINILSSSSTVTRNAVPKEGPVPADDEEGLHSHPVGAWMMDDGNSSIDLTQQTYPTHFWNPAFDVGSEEEEGKAISPIVVGKSTFNDANEANASLYRKRRASFTGSPDSEDDGYKADGFGVEDDVDDMYVDDMYIEDDGHERGRTLPSALRNIDPSSYYGYEVDGDQGTMIPPFASRSPSPIRYARPDSRGNLSTSSSSSENESLEGSGRERSRSPSPSTDSDEYGSVCNDGQYDDLDLDYGSRQRQRRRRLQPRSYRNSWRMPAQYTVGDEVRDSGSTGSHSHGNSANNVAGPSTPATRSRISSREGRDTMRKGRSRRRNPLAEAVSRAFWEREKEDKERDKEKEKEREKEKEKEKEKNESINLFNKMKVRGGGVPSVHSPNPNSHSSTPQVDPVMPFFFSTTPAPIGLSPAPIPSSTTPQKKGKKAKKEKGDERPGTADSSSSANNFGSIWGGGGSKSQPQSQQPTSGAGDTNTSSSSAPFMWVSRSRPVGQGLINATNAGTQSKHNRDAASNAPEPTFVTLPVSPGEQADDTGYLSSRSTRSFTYEKEEKEFVKEQESRVETDVEAYVERRVYGSACGLGGMGSVLRTTSPPPSAGFGSFGLTSRSSRTSSQRRRRERAVSSVTREGEEVEKEKRKSEAKGKEKKRTTSVPTIPVDEMFGAVSKRSQGESGGGRVVHDYTSSGKKRRENAIRREEGEGLEYESDAAVLSVKTRKRNVDVGWRGEEDEVEEDMDMRDVIPQLRNLKAGVRR